MKQEMALTSTSVQVDPCASADLSKLSDVDYLLARSVTCLTSGDVLGCKSWLCTARLAFPNNLSVQLSAYETATTYDKDPREAARNLTGMLSTSKKDIKDPRLKKELDKIVTALLESDDEAADIDKSQIFLRDVYNQLPSEWRKTILLDEASSCYSSGLHHRHAVLTLEVIRRFPELSPQLGPTLLHHVCSTLLTRPPSGKKKALSNVAYNQDQAQLSQLLIQHLAPQLLSSERSAQIKLDSMDIDSLLELTLSCAVEYVAKRKRGGKHSKLCPFPWKKAKLYSEEAGLRIGWSITQDLSEECETTESMLERMRSYARSGRATGNELFFVAALGLFQAVQEYFDALSSVEGEAILVEAFVGQKSQQEQLSVTSSPQPLNKRRRTNTAGDSAEQEQNEQHTVLTHGLPGTESAVAAFKIVVGFLDVLQADRSMDAKFQPLLSKGGDEMRSLLVDVELYRRDIRKAMQHLGQLTMDVVDDDSDGPAAKLTALRHHLRSAGVAVAALKEGAAEDALVRHCVMATISSFDAKLPKLTSKGDGGILYKPKQHAAAPKRHVHFLPLTCSAVVSYCSRVLINIFKEVLGGFGGPNPVIRTKEASVYLAQMLVLLQRLYPDEKDMFLEVIDRIRIQQGFRYPGLVSYLHQIDFLEEMSALSLDEMVRSGLDIGSASSETGASSARKMGTRGASRGEKEELAAQLVAQARSATYGAVEDKVIVEFLRTEYSYLFTT